MATIRLVPSAYTRSSTNRVTVTNPENMYYNTDHTASYCSIRGRNSSSSTYYCFIHGFNFDDVPSEATVTSFSVKIRCYRSSNQNTGTSYNLRLASQASSSYVISNTTASNTIDTTASIITIPTGSLTWDTLSGYGSGFSIDVVLRSTDSSYPYVYVYGAEIEVNYTMPVNYDVTVTNSTSATVTPTGTTSVTEGHSFTVTTDSLSGITVTDNNTDVTNQFVQQTSGTATMIPESNTNSNFTLTNISNAYAGADSTTYAQLQIAGSTTGTIYLNLAAPSLPTGATIQSVTCQATTQFNANSSSSGFTSSMQMYTGSTAKGSATQWVSSGSNVAKNTYTLSIGSWTASELASAKFYITATNSARSTQRQIYVYGVTMTVTYQFQGSSYQYTISNVQGDHTIVFSSGGSQPTLYIKQNGTWKQVQRAYKKVNDSWTQIAVDQAFTSGANYVKGTL